jgi:uncharacterized membrane protein YdbT with pleckstrin-like domain
MEAEKTIHQTNPSQIVNLKYFIVSALLLAAVVALSFWLENPTVLVLVIVPLAYAWWRWMYIKSFRLTITDQRIIVSQGIFKKVTNETELYRVRDTSIEEPFFYRIFGVGNIVIYSSDDAQSKLLFNAYRKPHWIKDQIRNYAEISRRNRRWGNDNIILQDRF